MTAVLTIDEMSGIDTTFDHVTARVDVAEHVHDDGELRAFELVSTTPTSTGVLVCRYQSAT